MMGLSDQLARTEALTRFDQTLLIEAGAGSGKTAVMAGRVALMLASGIPANAIVAITFTEAAASELLTRIRRYVETLSSNQEIPRELGGALPNGLSPQQRRSLNEAEKELDELTCTTIHGFCQRLIRPYPIETNMDPGASIADPVGASLLLDDTIDEWLRDHLDGESEGFVAEFVRHDAKKAVQYVRDLVKTSCDYPGVEAPVARADETTTARFIAASHAFAEVLDQGNVTLEEATAAAAAMHRLSSFVKFDAPRDLVALLTLDADDVLSTAGTFKEFRHKGKYEAAAGFHGVSKAVAVEEFNRVKAFYDTAKESWSAVKDAAASQMLAGLMRETNFAVEHYQQRKKRAALLDFNDLLQHARDLLANDPKVCQALGERYKHVLVDEFQDTDPLQAEILWRLCGIENPEAPSDWTKRIIRPGALFLVGDPKQAIYRFRGADVTIYTQARESLRQLDGAAVRSISTNFRSRAGVLEFVNRCFEGPLSSEGQPGFTPLDVGRLEKQQGPAVTVLHIQGHEKMKIKEARDLEATAVADLCSRLIGAHEVPSEDGGFRAAQPRDIALLAPTGSDLHIYEAALESFGLPVASQAGKSFWLRQEIQDLVALTRVLADSRDRLALLALLRGPLVGMTDEEIFDLGLAMAEADDSKSPEAATSDTQQKQDRGEVRARLSVNADLEMVGHPLARDILERLQTLRRMAGSTTPHHLLSQAVDHLNLRPLLRQRHARPQRVLANLQAFLELSRPYSVRGLQDFATSITNSWSDTERAVEGRADVQEDAIALVTMHSSKGLEWPIVIPVNTVSGVRTETSSFIDRAANRLYRKILGAEPLGFEEASKYEKEEIQFERQRLWYVATTRAKEKLVLPFVEIPKDKSSRWYSVVNLLGNCPNIENPELYSSEKPVVASVQGNQQTRAIFLEEAQRIAEARPQRQWLMPSRDEWNAETAAESEEPEELQFLDLEAEVIAPPPPQGGRERGTVMHKLFEEILMGELDENPAEVEARAQELIRMLGLIDQSDATSGLSPAELAATVTRSLALPEVAALRPNLDPELPVLSSQTLHGTELVTVGVADAINWSSNGRALVVVDWKSDVDPGGKTIDKYKSQLRAYLQATGAERGLLVFATTGRSIQVVP